MMKMKFALLLSAFVAFNLACFEEGTQTCSVKKDTKGVTSINCPDGSSATVDGGSVTASSNFKRSFSCGGPIAATGLFYSYYATETGAGDVMVYGAIESASFQIGTASFYAKNASENATGLVLITDDTLGTPTGGFWEMRLSRTTKVVTINYLDAEVGAPTDDFGTNDKLSFTMPAGDCVSAEY